MYENRNGIKKISILQNLLQDFTILLQIIAYDIFFCLVIDDYICISEIYMSKNLNSLTSKRYDNYVIL